MSKFIPYWIYILETENKNILNMGECYTLERLYLEYRKYFFEPMNLLVCFRILNSKYDQQNLKSKILGMVHEKKLSMIHSSGYGGHNFFKKDIQTCLPELLKTLNVDFDVYEKEETMDILMIELKTKREGRYKTLKNKENQDVLNTDKQRAIELQEVNFNKTRMKNRLNQSRIENEMKQNRTMYEKLRREKNELEQKIMKEQREGRVENKKQRLKERFNKKKTSGNDLYNQLKSNKNKGQKNKIKEINSNIKKANDMYEKLRKKKDEQDKKVKQQKEKKDKNKNKNNARNDYFDYLFALISGADTKKIKK